MKKEKNSPETPSVSKKETAPKASAKTAEVSAETTATAENAVSKVGNLLKEMRLRKGLKITDIAKKLCIRRCYLEAIEESNYKEIPDFPYGVGFIRSYADFLGLNSSNIIELYKEETNSKQDKDIYVLEPQTEATVPSKKYLFISLIAIAAVYAGWHAYSQKASDTLNNEETVVSADDIQIESAAGDLPLVVEDYSSADAENASQPLQENAVANVSETDGSTQQITMTDASFSEPAPEESATPKAEPETPATPQEGVVIKVKAETWIEVKDENKLYLSKVLIPGDTYTVPEGKGMILSSGKADGVDVYINGVLTPVFSSRKKMNVPLDKFLTPAAE